jgi:hypothetical protein
VIFTGNIFPVADIIPGTWMYTGTAEVTAYDNCIYAASNKNLWLFVEDYMASGTYKRACQFTSVPCLERTDGVTSVFKDLCASFVTIITELFYMKVRRSSPHPVAAFHLHLQSCKRI